MSSAARGLLLSLTLLVAADARAIGAVGFETWTSGEADEQVAPGTTVTATGGGLAASMAGNPGLGGSAWAHTGAWWSFYADGTTELRIRVEADVAADFAPGLSVWAIGPNGPFDGGTTGFGSETSTAGWGTPHSFNAFGALGDAGTLWMQAGQGGNAQELLAYAIAGPSLAGPGGWGETIENGAHDLRLGDDFATGVSGLVGAGFAELRLQGVSPGWFTLYAGGTNPALVGSGFTLSVISVPEPGTALLMAAGIAGLAHVRRRRA